MNVLGKYYENGYIYFRDWFTTKHLQRVKLMLVVIFMLNDFSKLLTLVTKHKVLTQILLYKVLAFWSSSTVVVN